MPTEPREQHVRFIHTADWHIGRLFHGVHLTEDQAHVLKQFVTLVRDEQPDAVFISGDLYDRAVPPPDALRLLDDVLCQIVLGLGVPVIAIRGNHDNPERLTFGARLLRSSGLHLCGDLSQDNPCLTLRDDAGPVHIFSLPYAEPPRVREHLCDDTVRTHDDAMRVLCARIAAARPQGERAVLVAHAFVVGGAPSDSERPLAVEGYDTVSSEYFAPFDYVALGHLHRAQVAGGRYEARYPGSLLKYSFSEADDAKSVSIVDLASNGECHVEYASLSPRRDVRCIEGHFAQLMTGAGDSGRSDDYLSIRLLDDGPVLDAMARLRTVYPNALQLERAYMEHAARAGACTGDFRTAAPEVLFADFFREVMPAPLTDAQEELFADVLETIRHGETSLEVVTT